MIRLLENNEKHISRALYSEAFAQDSESFKDYYYKEKTADNKIIADLEENDVKAMLHLNPYRMCFLGKEYEIYYIVAVATAIKYRRRGLMRELLKKSFRLMYEEHKPFTFLLPANPAYYEPFDFTFISNYTKTLLNDEGEIVQARYEESDREDVLRFFASYSESVADVYCIRDQKYLERLLKELESERGYLELLRKKGEVSNHIIGSRSYWGNAKKECREFLCDKAYARIVETEKAYMMARIIDLREFLRGIRLKEDARAEQIGVAVKVYDRFIEENAGYFFWEIGKNGSVLEDCKTVPKDYTEFTIEELTAWLFGYRQSGKAEFCKEIKTADSVFINEEV